MEIDEFGQRSKADLWRLTFSSINLMETLLHDINHGFLYTHRGQIEPKICHAGANDETMTGTIKLDKQLKTMEFCYNT